MRLLESIFNHRKELIFSVLFALEVSALLWITLLSRVPGARVVYLIPLNSWFQAFKGDKQWILENIGNILMFLPLGFLLNMIIGEKKKCVALCFGFSLFIEIVQLITRLGSFEVDDLIHNTLGCFIGAAICQMIGIRKIEWKKIWKYCVFVTASMFLLSVSCNNTYKIIHHQKMVAYATLGDIDGKKNLLVLTGKNGYTWNKSVYIKYLDDGSFSVIGDSNSRLWFPIGDITLEPGEYVFSGLSGVEQETVGLELEYKNKDNKYMRMIDDVGPVASVKFILEEATDIRAYVTVYPGCDCDVIARPLIYKEGE